MDELKIIKYLDGEMSGEELRDFEKEIGMNQPLADEVAKFREVQELAGKLLQNQESEEKGPGAEVEQEISAAVKDFKENPEYSGDIPRAYRRELELAEKGFLEKGDKPGSLHLIRRIWFAAAAVVILAVILSVIFFQSDSKLPDYEIFAEYNAKFNKTEEIIELARADNDFLFASEVYQAGDYERAGLLFEILADSSELRTWSLLYAGSSYMFTNQTEKAIDLLLQVGGDVEEVIISQVRWRLALCYIKTGNYEDATKNLELLLNDPVYRRDANKILRILR